MRRFFAPPQTIAEYSDQLRRRLAGVLPPERIDEVVAETEAHLSDVADELRRQPDVYERQAVLQFAPAGSLARGIRRAWAPTYLRHAGTRPLQLAGLAVAAAVLVTTLAQTAFSERLGYRPFPLAPMALGVILCFVLALAACRHQLSRSVWALLAALGVGALVGGARFGMVHPRYAVSRYDAPAVLANYEALSALYRQEIAQLESGRSFCTEAVALRSESAWPSSLRTPDGIVLPRAYDYGSSAFHCGGLGAAQPLLWTTHDLAQARRVWSANADRWISRQHDLQRLNQGVRNKLVALQAAPKVRFDPDAARWLSVRLGVVAGAMLAADLAGGALGSALLRLRRRRRPLAAA